MQGAATNFTLVVVYRSGSLASTTAFFDDFADLVEHVAIVAVNAAPLIITGDLNLHLVDHSASSTISFLYILNGAGLVQLVNGLTHRAGHTLDVIIARTDTVVSVVVDTPIFSNRSFVTLEFLFEASEESRAMMTVSKR